jgi:AraC-like DNA-binding protein
MKIVDIALDAGFASLSRFYATFSAACHCTPTAYRKRFIPL